MAVSTTAKQWLNRLLAAAGLKITTLTEERLECARIELLTQRGHFDGAHYHLLPQLAQIDLSPFVRGCKEYSTELEKLTRPELNEVGYDFANEYFPLADAHVLYLIARLHRPIRWVEVGSGNSTKVVRQAIRDGNLKTTLTSVDPLPRIEVSDLADVIYRCRVEEMSDDVFLTLQPGDVLFIDSSHEIKPGNDVLRLYLSILPRLPSGVIVHVHDIFLPYEYPRDWILRGYNFREQYLVHAILQGTRKKVVWPGYYVQRDRPEMMAELPLLSFGRAQSFWYVH